MSKTKLVFIIVVITLLIWLAVYTPPFLGASKFSLISLFRFPLRATHNASAAIRDFVGSRIHKKWVEENERLKQALSQRSFDHARVQELEAENRRLKKLLEFRGNLSCQTIPARVIGRDSALLSRTLLIDRGKQDGIYVGMAAVLPTGLVGKIIEANTTVSRLMLLEDPDLRLGVIIQRTREEGLLVGGKSGSAMVIYLDSDSAVQPGDMVVSAPASLAFPKGLLIGSVETVSMETTGLYKIATVAFAARSSGIDEVLCIKSN